MGDAFEYVLIKTFEVGTDVLFGDKEDVQLKNLKLPDEISSEGGTIVYTLRHRTSCFPGTWCQSIIKIDEHSYHLIHEQGCSGEKLGRHLLKCKTADFNDPNVWSRYDWCHWRNWGRKSTYAEDEDKDADEQSTDAEDEGADEQSTDAEAAVKNKVEDEDEDAEAAVENKVEDEDKDKDEDEDEDAEEQSNDSRHSIYFVSVLGGIVVSTVVLDASCIEGDWNYGFRMTDPDSGLAFAYGFGDYLVNRELCGDVDEDDLTESLQVCKSRFIDE